MHDRVREGSNGVRVQADKKTKWAYEVVQLRNLEKEGGMSLKYLLYVYDDSGN